MTERKIAGWFYRNGRRIPIFEKATPDQRRRVSKAEIETAKRKTGKDSLVDAVAYGMNPENDKPVIYQKDDTYLAGTYDDAKLAGEAGWKGAGITSQLARETGLFDDRPKNRAIKREPDREALRKNVLGDRKRSGYRLPQEKEYRSRKPSEDRIKQVMKDYGYARADAIKFIQDKSRNNGI